MPEYIHTHIQSCNLNICYTFKAEVEVEAVTDFLFLGSKITVDGDCSHRIRRYLFLGKKAMKKIRQCIKKQ